MQTEQTIIHVQKTVKKGIGARIAHDNVFLIVRNVTDTMGPATFVLTENTCATVRENAATAVFRLRIQQSVRLKMDRARLAVAGIHSKATGAN